MRTCDAAAAGCTSRCSLYLTPPPPWGCLPVLSRLLQDCPHAPADTLRSTDPVTQQSLIAASHSQPTHGVWPLNTNP